MNNAVFGKTKKNVRKHRSIKPVTTGRRGNLVSEQNYDTTSSSQTMYQQQKREKTQILMNKPVYLGLSTLNLSKTECMNFGLIMQNQNMVKRQRDTDSFIRQTNA